MALKPTTTYIGSVDDEAVKVPHNGTDYSAATITALVEAYPEIFSLVTNPNGQTDLKFFIDDTIPYVVSNFKQASNGNPYSLTSVDYYGGQPKTRCPQCP